MTLDPSTNAVTTHQPPSNKRAISKHPVVQSIGYLVAVLLALPPLLQAASTPVSALIVGLFYLVLLGSIGYGIKRWRGSERTWTQVTFGR